MRTKRGIKLYGLNPEMLWCCDVVERVYREHGVEPVITSPRYGDRHSSKSRHYSVYALDFRTRGIAQHTLALIYNDLRDELKPLGFDVLLEYSPAHLHIEFDPVHKYKYPKAWPF